MKLTTTLILALTTLATATPAPASEHDKRAVNCDDCQNRYDFCFNVGRLQL
jgi:hypothetical protein